MIFQILGVLSALIFIIADIPYLRDTIKGKTKPQRVTWGVVVLLNLIGFANQYAAGATNSLWIFGAAAIMTCAIFIASIKKGVGGHSKLDVFSIVAALLGIVLWQLLDSPLYSIFANIFIGTVALIPTFAKAKKHPETETKITWLLGVVSVFFAALSVGAWNWQLLILPLSSAILQGYMVYILYFETRRKKS